MILLFHITENHMFFALFYILNTFSNISSIRKILDANMTRIIEHTFLNVY